MINTLHIRFTHFAMAASRIALEDAKLDTVTTDSDKFGVLIGSGIGGVEFFEDNCNKFTAAGAGGAGLKKVTYSLHLLELAVGVC
jgi:3-oxoacyl-(acyl-carrier-protein) synthase